MFRLSILPRSLLRKFNVMNNRDFDDKTPEKRKKLDKQTIIVISVLSVFLLLAVIALLYIIFS